MHIVGIIVHCFQVFWWAKANVTMLVFLFYIHVLLDSTLLAVNISLSSVCGFVVVAECLPLRTPENGAMACQHMKNAKYCQVFCQKGLTFSLTPQLQKSISNGQMPQEYVCSHGKWTPHEFTAPCARMLTSRFFLYNIQLYQIGFHQRTIKVIGFHLD